MLDRRLISLIVVVIIISVLGLVIHQFPDSENGGSSAIEADWTSGAKINPIEQSELPGEYKRSEELEIRFQQAVTEMQAEQYELAVSSLHRALELNPILVEAHVNMGFALMELQELKAARDFFLSAIDLNPQQANAYYGLAVTHERGGDLESALGAMRTFIHFTNQNDPYLRKARAAIWEWQVTIEERRKATGPG